MRSLTVGLALAALVTGVALTGPTASAEAVEYRAGRYTAATPARLHDTRAYGAIGPGGTARVALGERVPADATAVVLTLTALNPTTTTTLTPYAEGTTRGGVAVHVRARESRAAQVVVGIADSRAVVLHNTAGHTHAVVDLVGFYRSGAGAGFHSVAPVRAATLQAVGARETRTVDLSGHVPAGAVAVAVTITADATAATYLTAWPTGAAKPIVGAFPIAPGETRTSFATVALGADRAFQLHQHAGTATVAVDVTGYYTATGGSAYQSRVPLREYDSRADYPSGLPGLPIPPRSRASFSVTGSVPQGATGVVLGVTGMSPTESTTLTAWTDFQGPRPEVAALSVPAWRTVSGTVTLGLVTEVVFLYNSAGRTHVAVDLLGYFLPEQR